MQFGAPILRKPTVRHRSSYPLPLGGVGFPGGYEFLTRTWRRQAATVVMRCTALVVRKKIRLKSWHQGLSPGPEVRRS